jgi:hypothetical protein
MNMKPTQVAAGLLAFVVAASSALFAAEQAQAAQTPTQTCRELAKKEHVSGAKLDAYMKSCVQKHSSTSATPAGGPQHNAPMTQ